MNPLHEPYGGINPRFYFNYRNGNATEYEIGITRTAEAIHCILGSLVGAYTYNTPELGHIMEEIGLIKKFMNEYSKSMYTSKRLFSGPYAEMTKDTILSLYPELKQIAKDKKQNLIAHKNEIPPEIYRVALACYNLLIVVADESVKSVKGRTTTNALATTRWRNAVSKLSNEIEKSKEYLGEWR